MAFDFNLSSDVTASNSSLSMLEPFKVHTVTLQSSEVIKTENSTRLETIFTNDEGEARIAIFLPKEQDMERREFASNNGTAKFPSTAENVKAALLQMMVSLNSEGYSALIAAQQAGKVKIKNFEDLFNYTAKLLTAAAGKTTNLKMLGRINQKGYPTYVLPQLVSLRKNVEPGQPDIYVSNNFIGDNVTISKREQERSIEYARQKKAAEESFKTAAPTVLNDADPIMGIGSDTFKTPEHVVTESEQDDALKALGIGI